MKHQTSTLEKLTLSQLLEAYGRTIQAIVEGADTAHLNPAQYNQLRTSRAAIEIEARRRDQSTWLPAQPTINREENGDIVFA